MVNKELEARTLQTRTYTPSFVTANDGALLLKAREIADERSNTRGSQRTQKYAWQPQARPPLLHFGSRPHVPLCLYSSVVLIVSGLPSQIAGPKHLFDLFRLFTPVAAFVYPDLNLHLGRYGEVQFRNKELAKEALASVQDARFGNQKLM